MFFREKHFFGFGEKCFSLFVTLFFAVFRFFVSFYFRFSQFFDFPKTEIFRFRSFSFSRNFAKWKTFFRKKFFVRPLPGNLIWVLLGVSGHKQTYKVAVEWKTGKPISGKLSVFLPGVKTDTIFGIYGIENPRKHCPVTF